MTQEQLVRLMYNMRQAQKEYFRTRSKEALERSKRLEKEADQVLERGIAYYNSKLPKSIVEAAEKYNLEIT